ncbi:MAG: ADP-ribosylglycohydrolase family protein [Clostridia bacterium]|nr:ADP-ribosylglycohydrolase family protein [Clostridia bacterium]
MKKNEIERNTADFHKWENYSKQLDVEYRQSLEEGKDIESLKPLFDAVAALPDSEYKDTISDAVFGMVCDAPIKAGYPYEEPSDIEGIRRLRKGAEEELALPEDGVIAEKTLGGWYGRICGCLLGKPVEGIKSPELKLILTRTGNYPMTRYIKKEEITDEVADGIRFGIKNRAYSENLGCMPSDDDTNYMIMGYKIVSKYGKGFTSADVAKVWLASQVKDAYCTAERVAYRNFIEGYMPPYSAEYKNPYREWIGAQIRGDFYGYICPGNPEQAADMAFRDAAISHIKNGIYGEMWVSAMIAAAYCLIDCERVIRRGLAEIPASSRLYKAITGVIDAYRGGVSCDEFFAELHRRYNEYDGHDWCHTVSNAEIVAACLLYGEKDYTRSVGMAVMQGFDTDCNGATVGSVLGVMLGYGKLPHAFIDFTDDTLCSELFGYERVSIRAMAEKTEKVRKNL